MKLSDSIEQWKQLKETRALLNERISLLRGEILGSVQPGQIVNGVTSQIRDQTSFSEDRVYDRMHYRDIKVELFTKRVIDPSKLEQLYLDGAISDDDLRYIREPKYICALVEVRGDTDVQG